MGPFALIALLAVIPPLSQRTDGMAALAGALRDPSSGELTKENAALTLGCIGGDEAVRHLEGALREAAPATRSHIARALGNTRSRLAVPVLIGMFRDDSARDDVCDALVTLTHRTWCDGGDDDVALRRAWRRWWSQMRSSIEIHAPGGGCGPEQASAIRGGDARFLRGTTRAQQSERRRVLIRSSCDAENH